jgi:DNA-directed RNA polymerase specialized sigma24 family protein
MRHSDKQIEQAAQRFEQLADTLDPDTAEVEDLSDLNAVAVASQAVEANEARLRAAVLAAREHGRSWNQLANALGVSRQAARQRFGDKIRN